MFKEQPPGIANAEAAQQAVEQTNAVLRSLHIKQDSLLHYYKWASQGFAGKFSKEQVKKLRQHPLIDHVAKDYYYKTIQTASSEEYKTTNSPTKATMTSSETIPWGVDRVGGPLDGTGKTAWVLDSGVDLDHPDLNVDASRSTSFVNSYTADDGLGHGTYVAGILAAKNNNTDLAGVAAGATIVAVRVCDDSGGCYVSDAKAGVEYVAANSSSGDVVNMSIGWPTDVSLPDIDIPLTDLENSIIDAANNNGLYFAISTSNAKV